MTLIPEQKMWDIAKWNEAKRRERAAERGTPTSVKGGGRAVVRNAIPALAAAITANAKPRHVGKYAAALPRVMDALRAPGRKRTELVGYGISAETLAYMTLRTVLDALGQERSLTSVAGELGRRVETECHMRAARRALPWLHDHALERTKHISGYNQRRRVLNRIFEKHPEIQWTVWELEEVLHVGFWFIRLLLEAEAPLIRRETAYKPGGKRAREVLLPTPLLTASIKALDEKIDELSPWFLPLNEEPKPWGEDLEGGYWTYPTDLVKSRIGNDNCIVPEKSDLRMALGALNALQRTAWSVNDRVLKVVERFWYAKVPIAGLASEAEIPMPPRPAHIPADVPIKDLPAEQQVEMKAWKRAKLKACTAEATRSSGYNAEGRIISVATMFRHEAAIYFPHQLDFRGRIYPVPRFLQPQGRDLERGLLHFAAAKALGDMGGFWLGVHGANLWGKGGVKAGFDVSKASMNDRVDWALDPHVRARVALVAADPEGDLWWTEADKPWQFLAWCFEWAAFLASGESAEFESRLAVSMDGSCNGLQHFAAMMRDEKGGAAVNLLPSGVPQDVYGLVAERLEAEVVADLAKEPFAGEWIASDLLTRSLVKRPVMTLPYGVTQVGARNQLRDEIKKLIAADKPVGLSNVRDATTYLNNHVWEIIGSTMEAAKRAMKFLHECVRACDGTIEWTAPNNLVIRQRYNLMEKSIVATTLMGRLQLVARRETSELNRRKQVAAIAPNFVHSLDSAHLMRTIAFLGADGVSWAMVHDSYGCHAGDAVRLAQGLRITFVEMYRDLDILGDLRVELEEQAKTPLPEVPEKGSLDVSEVIRSEYFFG